MTINKFLRKLREASLEWNIDRGMIRTVKRFSGDSMARLLPCYCPIAAVYNREPGVMPITDFSSAGYALGLKWQDKIKIVHAADKMTGYDPELRNRLLDAVGLTE